MAFGTKFLGDKSEHEHVPPKPLRPEYVRFAQGMVRAADAACLPGPTTDGDMLPRESVSGMYLRAHVTTEGESLGAGPVDKQQAARVAIEQHTRAKPGRYYDAVVDDSDETVFVVRLHLLDPNPPFLPHPEAEASYRVDRQTGQMGMI